MAHNITQDNTYFSNVNVNITAVGKKVVSFHYNAKLNNELYYNPPILNAIDVDWDGATLTDGTVINTTGQLLNYIYNLKVQADQLGASNTANTASELSKVKAIYIGGTQVFPPTPTGNYIYDDGVMYDEIASRDTIAICTREFPVYGNASPHKNVINAIDIDWNNATRGSIGPIDTSGAFLKIIDDIAQDIVSLGGVTTN